MLRDRQNDIAKEKERLAEQYYLEQEKVRIKFLAKE